ncbi:MAG: hypothetical protein QOF32_2225 [Gammaproteobacteria bacterium]|jgi:hypothetical protein|nr:hypothetical protein [Gammaproteobacteria bacterium]
MKPKMRRNLPGTFETLDLGEGAWRLSRGEAAPADVFIRGAESGAADVFRLPYVRDIDIEWRAEAVVLTTTSAEQQRTVNAQSVIVHEPLVRLYEALPLVTLDAKARRFWRRVFLLVRIPGGRYLLGALARRTRGRR